MPVITLSSEPMLSPFFGAKILPNTDFVDYVDGPIGISNTAQGLYHQTWRFRLTCQKDVSLVSPNYPETKIFSRQGTTAIAGSFDQNGRYLLSYIDYLKDMYIYWFDPSVNQYVSTLLDSDVDSMRMDMDDRRPSQVALSNVHLVYTKNGNLYCRVQNDRFGVAYLIQEGVRGRVIKVGMNTANRFQILFEQNPFPVYEDPYPPGTI